jgi:hypothetical protein
MREGYRTRQDVSRENRREFAVLESAAGRSVPSKMVCDVTSDQRLSSATASGRAAGRSRVVRRRRNERDRRV